MKNLVLLLLLGGCVSQWPAGSYNDLAKGADSEAITGAIGECAANLVPGHAMVYFGALQPPDALSLMLPEALSHQGLSVSEGGLPLTYTVASTGTNSQARTSEGAFVRVSAPRGVCAQYFTRDSNGILQSAGPVMLVLQ
jgi:hypothetical protein